MISFVLVKGLSNFFSASFGWLGDPVGLGRKAVPGFGTSDCFFLGTMWPHKAAFGDYVFFVYHVYIYIYPTKQIISFGIRAKPLVIIFGEFGCNATASPPKKTLPETKKSIRWPGEKHQSSAFSHGDLGKA